MLRDLPASKYRASILFKAVRHPPSRILLGAGASPLDGWEKQ